MGFISGPDLGSGVQIQIQIQVQIWQRLTNLLSIPEIQNDHDLCPSPLQPHFYTVELEGIKIRGSMIDLPKVR